VIEGTGESIVPVFIGSHTPTAEPQLNTKEKNEVPNLMQSEGAHAHGVYEIICYGRDGEEKWRDSAENTVVTVGKNLALGSYLGVSGGSAPGGSGPYMGLIGSSGYTSTSASDTMTSHAGWTESTVIAARLAPTWASASGGSLSTASAVSFSITGTDTIEGCFIVFGSGASTTVSNTSGTLYSAGTFTGGSKSVGSGDTLNVSYTASI
jgi:hypothetical protein